MSLPASLSGVSWPDFLNSPVGPWESGGNLYVCLPDKTGHTAEVYKSTNGGVTWAEMDAAHHPAIYDGAGYETVQGFLAGTTLYVGYLGGSGRVIIQPFDLSNDTWGTASTTTDAPVPTANVSGAIAFGFVVDSSANYIVYHQSALGGTGSAYRRTKYCKFTAGTPGSWGTDTAVDAASATKHYDYRAIALGAADRAHFIFTITTDSGLMHRSLSSAASLDTVATVDADVNVGNYSVGLPLSYADASLGTTRVLVPYVDSSNELRLLQFDSGANPGIYTGEAISATSTSNPEATNSNPGALAVTGTQAIDQAYIGNDDSNLSAYGASWLEESFTPAGTHTPKTVRLKLLRANAPGAATVSIKAVDANHKPTGNDLAAGTFNADTLGTAATWIRINLAASAQLTGSTEYAIVIRAVDGSVTKTLGPRYDAGGASYAGGQRGNSGNSGSTWTLYSDTDIVFDEGTPEVIRAFWPDDTTQDIFTDNDNCQGGWGADSEWADGVTCQGISANAITGGVGLLFDDGGTVKYNDYLVPRTVTATGRASTVAFGEPEVTQPSGAQTITATGKASGLVFGSPTVTPGPVTVTASGKASAAAFGAPTVTPGAVTISPTGKASDVAFGQPTVTPGAVTISPSGLASTAAIGEPAVTPGPVTISPSGLASGAAIGEPTVSPGAVTISPTGVVSGVAFGNPAVTPGTVTISPAGRASTATMGEPSVTVGTVTVRPAGKASGAAIGQPTVVPGAVTVSPSGRTSTVAFGQPAVMPDQNLVVTGIASTLAFGEPTVAYVISPAGIASATAIGQPTVTVGTVTIRPIGKGSAAVIGEPTVKLQPRPASALVSDTTRVRATVSDSARVTATVSDSALVKAVLEER